MSDPQPVVFLVALASIGAAIASLVPGMEQNFGLSRERAFFGSAAVEITLFDFKKMVKKVGNFTKFSHFGLEKSR
jgi:hypothetical protein